MINQVLRNRKPNVNGRRHKWNAKDHVPLAKVDSLFLGKPVALRMFGGHLLQFDGVGPDRTESIRWDKKQITEDQLVRLLKFELDPDDPRIKLDIRRRSKPLPLLDADF